MKTQGLENSTQGLSESPLNRGTADCRVREKGTQGRPADEELEGFRIGPKARGDAGMMPVSNFLRASIFILSVVATTILFASTVLLMFLFTFYMKKRSFLHWVGIYWARSIIALNPSWHFEIRGRENLPKHGKPVVIVSNHVSQTDILAIFSIGVDFRWLSKASVFKVPFLGWAMSAVGYVPVIRGNKASHKLAMEMSKRHLRQGTSMVFFPEGTRSPDGRLRSFKPGAFFLAQEASVPILPITLQGTEKLLPKGSIVPGTANVIVTIHPEVHMLENEDVQAFTARTHKILQERLPPSMRS